MYVIIVTVYSDAFTIKARRVWKGRIFDSFDIANDVKNGILVNVGEAHNINLVVKAIR